MKRIRSIEQQKVAIIKQCENNGVVEICRKHNLYPTTYYVRKKKYKSDGEAGLQPKYLKTEHRELNKLTKENELLKKIIAEKELQLNIANELLIKRPKSGRTQNNYPQGRFFRSKS
jgi:putative transposase